MSTTPDSTAPHTGVEAAPPSKPRRITPNQIAVKVLIEQGFSDSEIAEQLTLSRMYVNTIRRNLQTNTNRYDLSRLEPQAVKSLKKLIKAEPFGSMDRVKCSTALAAAKEVLDRTQPKINVSVSESYQFASIPERFQGPAVLDVTPGEQSNDNNEIGGSESVKLVTEGEQSGALPNCEQGK